MDDKASMMLLPRWCGTMGAVDSYCGGGRWLARRRSAAANNYYVMVLVHGDGEGEDGIVCMR